MRGNTDLYNAIALDDAPDAVAGAGAITSWDGYTAAMADAGQPVESPHVAESVIAAATAYYDDLRAIDHFTPDEILAGAGLPGYPGVDDFNRVVLDRATQDRLVELNINDAGD